MSDRLGPGVLAPAWRLTAARLRSDAGLDEISDPDDSEAVRAILDAGQEPLDRALVARFGPLAPVLLRPFRTPRPSRFSDGTFGVLYAAGDPQTAEAEYGFHLVRFLRATEERGTPVQALRLRMEIAGDTMADICGLMEQRPELYDPDPGGYGRAQSWAGRLVSRGSDGVLYSSVRRPGGTCAGAFDAAVVYKPADEGLVVAEWNGRHLTSFRPLLPLQ